MSNLQVSLDDRARLLTAVLSISHWPQMEQAIVTHAVTPQSKRTSQLLEAHKEHPAVTQLNQLLEDGVSLADLFDAVLSSDWPSLNVNEPIPNTVPEGWLSNLATFYTDANVENVWAQTAVPWQEAHNDLTDILGKSCLYSFVGDLRGSAMDKTITVIPTIVYPMLEPVITETQSTIYMILPPAKAWGESPPWPHGEDPGWVVGQTCYYLVGYILRHTLSQTSDEQTRSVQHGAVVLCLEKDFDDAEAMSYLVRRKKEEKLPKLPLFVEQLRDVVEGQAKLADIL